MHSLVAEITALTRHARKDDSGRHIRRLFGYAPAPEGVEANADGQIAVSILTPDATLRDAAGKPVVSGTFTEFGNVTLTRELDQEDQPRVTGQRETPCYQMRFTATSSAKNVQRGLSFDECVEDATPAPDAEPAADAV